MTEAVGPYATARGVETAIAEAARKAARADSSLDVNKRIQLEYFNRLLSRVFCEGEKTEWILKGGTGMLARIPSTRATRDIDLYRHGFTLEQSLSDLRRLVSTDLGDHFRFEYAAHEVTIAAEAQPYIDGYRVTFGVFIGVAKKGVVQIDLAAGAGMTGETQTTFPATTLHLPRLASYPYRLYPVVDQIADKVCATMSDYEGRQSSREKDLVDLVVLAVTQRIEGNDLAFAINTERRRRNMHPFDRFIAPASWGSGYVRQSRTVPHCAAYRTVEQASGLVARLIDPVLAGQALGLTWSVDELRWQ